jgi:hypothetical protein
MRARFNSANGHSGNFTDPLVAVAMYIREDQDQTLFMQQYPYAQLQPRAKFHTLDKRLGRFMFIGKLMGKISLVFSIWLQHWFIDNLLPHHTPFDAQGIQAGIRHNARQPTLERSIMKGGERAKRLQKTLNNCVAYRKKPPVLFGTEGFSIGGRGIPQFGVLNW